VRAIWPGTTPVKKKANPIWGLLFLAGAGLAIWGFLWPKTTTTTTTPNSGTVLVTYKLAGSASGADLTYTDGSGNIQQQTGRAVPVTTSGKEGMSFTSHHGAYVSFMAQNNDASGNLTCSIEADGVPINTGQSSGGYAIVSCSATLP